MNNFITVFKKELLDIFRDKKSLLFTLLLPIILYPAMFKFMSSSMESTQKDAEKGINIYIDGNKNSDLVNILKEQDHIKFPEVSDATKALKDGDLQLIIKIPENFDEDVLAQKNSKIEILIDEESNKSMLASSMVSDIYNIYKNAIVESRLAEKGISPDIIKPFDISIQSGINIDSEDISGIGNMLMNMIPTFLIIFMVSSTLGMAADLGAGEKERFTFEPLLSTSAKRSSILWGKISSICVISLIALMANMSSMVFSMNLFMNSGESFTISLNAGAIMGIISISIFVLISLSALQMAISLYARSSKEANTYLATITMPVFLLAYLPFMMDAKNINALFFNIPISNAICLMKEFMVGIFDIKHIAIVFAWHVCYVIAAITFAKFMFSKEEVIFRN